MRSRRWWDAPAALLLLIALLTGAGRLIATEWVDHLNLVQTLAFLGVAAGLALGQSMFPPALAFAFGLLYGLFFVPWQVLINVGLLSDDALWSDRVIVLANRLLNALELFAQQESVQDPVLFLFGMGALAWTLSVHAGYSLTRRGQPWRIILPTGVAVLLIHTSDPYRPRGIWYLAGYLLFALLLLARLTFLQLRSRWEQDRARIPPLVGLDLSYVITAAAAVLILLAWTVPTMADVLPTARRLWEQATDPWEERMDRLFASLDRRGATITAADYYSDDFPLGRGRELSDALVASVQAPTEGPFVRYYWRARVYDHYADGRWSTAALTQTERVRPSTFDFPSPELEARRMVTLTVTSAEPMRTLFVAPQPRWAGRPVDVDLAENPDETVDIAALHAAPLVGAGESYQIRSSVAAVTISQLRDAGTDYPAWVTERYLALPESITPRTRQLAEDIVGDRETPYDRVAAVTRYLRNNIRYSETITSTPSRDQEPLDWFLFDLKIGFCNYYASSQVVLLRSLGIPARLAVGFSAGEHQGGTNTYLVYERNAHAWPEVYFPGLGWVEFEPTVSQDPIVRPLGEIETDDDRSLRVPPGGDTEDRWRERLAGLEGLDEIAPGEGVPTASRGLLDRIGSPYVLAGVSLALILVVLAWRARRRINLPFPVFLEREVRRIGWAPPRFLRRWARYALLRPLERAYIEVDRALARLGVSPQPADTPAERAAALAHALPAASTSANRLLAEYQAATYSPHHCSLHAARGAARTIRKLSWMAKLRRLVARNRE
jgi:transglutaminase-like putative cysteine protease